MKKTAHTSKSKTLSVSSPKGMRDLMNEEYYSFQGFFEKAQEIAVYYGFKPIETPMLENEEIFTLGIGEGTDIIEKEMYTLKTKGYALILNMECKICLNQ
ncbi:MAG: Histidine-tRNA ligase [Candidatus Yanofskybacteria bacterium GW2011_GWC2_37_9]|uniref:Histidine-tRNA ligase n=1 Tax=Candidatus Yanofskybacteria bacterium GW2011_GWC2_37_9 TaxID=1619028 RepID=A0A0G0HU74_9BACT|nr:MAG: Histidine-tRNA ligase [Candidatus Yanofskybacteria bacterium GW2011_GWC2_37_9]